MSNCITPELIDMHLSAPQSLSSSPEKQPSSAGTMITTQLSPRRVRKRSILKVVTEPIIEVKKSSSRPITATSCSCSRKRQRRRKEATVRFAPVPHQTHEVPRWTKDEAASSWYSKHDFLAYQYQQAIDAAVLRTLIQTASTIGTLPQEPAVYRGLERLLSAPIAREISDRRKRCVMSVLVAQHRGLNVDLIAEVSQNISDKGAAWALTLGSI